MGNDAHRSSARLRAKRLCPQPPPQRTPPRTPLIDSDYMKKRGGSAPARIGPPLPSTSTHRSRPVLDSADIDDATGGKRKAGTYPPSPSRRYYTPRPAGAPPSSYAYSCTRFSASACTGVFHRVLPLNDDLRIQTSPPRPHAGGASASASIAHFPPPIVTTRRGRGGGGRASASMRMTPRASTCSPAFGPGYYSSRRPRGRGRRGDGEPAPPCAPAPAPAAAGPASTAHSTAYSPSTTTAHSESKRMARASRAMDDDGRGNGGSAERWTRGTRSGYRVSPHNDGGGSVGGREIQGGLVLLPEVKHGHG
jgi:hypothetical protein